MEHAYLREKLDSVLGLNTTRCKTLVYLNSKSWIMTAQADTVIAFDSSVSTIVKRYPPPDVFKEQDEAIQINDIVASPNGAFVATGYSNGEIVVFDIDGEVLNHFIGHRRAITCLAFNEDSNTLASGSQDNDVILWDISGDSGICRLTGHQNTVTDLQFIPNSKWLASSSKDTHIRVWDLELQICVQTYTAMASEIWSLRYIPKKNQMVCGGRGGLCSALNIASSDDVDPTNPIVLTLSENIQTNTNRRISSIFVNDACSLIALISDVKIITISIHSEDQMKKKRRRKKARSKAKQLKQQDGEEGDDEPQEDAPQQTEEETAVAQYSQSQEILTSAKICASNFVGKNNIAISLADNSISIYSPDKDNNYQAIHNTQGHNTDIRGIAMTEDQIISVSDGQCRVWDFESRQCVQNFECGDALCLTVLAGGRFVIIGTKKGELQMADLSSGEIYDRLKAHSGIIWSIDVTKDCSEIASGGDDHEVKFWCLRFQNDRPILVHKRTLKVTDEIYAIAYNHDATLIAAALLDSTVRIFHVDTLNFHLSLYGSQLPVTSIAFSDDGALIVTGSADKNIRIWGTEFGDCHRSLWAHDLPVTCVRFEPKTHYCWSTGRDGVIKEWDCDRFLCIQTLRSHIAEIWTFTISEHAQYLITGGRDKGLRIWKKSKEQLYISEERENQLTRKMEQEGAEKVDRTVAAMRGSILGGAVTDLAARQSVESIRHGDLLSDAILEADKEQESPGGNPLMRDITPSEYVLKTVQKINRANIDIVMQSLPFDSAVSLIKWMLDWLRQRIEVELSVRCICALIKYHRTQLEVSDDVRPLFIEAQTLVHEQVKELRSRCGMNLAALKLISRQMKEK